MCLGATVKNLTSKVQGKTAKPGKYQQSEQELADTLEKYANDLGPAPNNLGQLGGREDSVGGGWSLYTSTSDTPSARSEESRRLFVLVGAKGVDSFGLQKLLRSLASLSIRFLGDVAFVTTQKMVHSMA